MYAEEIGEMRVKTTLRFSGTEKTLLGDKDETV